VLVSILVLLISVASFVHNSKNCDVTCVLLYLRFTGGATAPSNAEIVELIFASKIEILESLPEPILVPKIAEAIIFRPFTRVM